MSATLRLMASVDRQREAFRLNLESALRGHKKGAVATNAGIDPGTLSKWLSSDKSQEPGVFALKRVADEIGVSVGYLLGEQGTAVIIKDVIDRASGAINTLSEIFGLPAVRRDETDNVLEFVPFKPRLEVSDDEFRFSVSPEDFQKKDFDYPQPWHYWQSDTPIEDLPALAAGPVGVPNLLNPRGANVREVFDRVNQIVRVYGDSMEDRYFDGDLVRVDTRIRNPPDGTPIAIYCDDLGGSLIGFLKHESDRVLLKKKNKAKYPDPIVLPDSGWILIGPIVQLVDRVERREIV